MLILALEINLVFLIKTKLNLDAILIYNAVKNQEQNCFLTVNFIHSENKTS